MFHMFQSIFPEYQWDIFQFNKIPKQYKKLLNESLSEQQDFVKYLENNFQIKKLSDWYLINSQEIKKIISMSLIDVMTIVKKIYPELNLNYFYLENSKKSKKSQYVLKSLLKNLFVDQEIVEEYRNSDFDYLELDYYIPQLKLAFEYQVNILNFYLNIFY